MAFVNGKGLIETSFDLLKTYFFTTVMQAEDHDINSLNFDKGATHSSFKYGMMKDVFN